MGCVDSGTVAAWISGRLPARDVMRLEAHADGCEACLHVLAAIGRVCADPHSRQVQRTHGAPVLADWVLLAAAPVHAIGRYRLAGVIGHGGFGVVYEAHDRELDRSVAIKALLARPDDENADAIRSEARALASLSHPNVVQVYDVVETAGRVFLVMELVRGETLRDWQRRGRRTTRETIEHYLAAAAGLVAIHDAGLVHADIKPDNLLVAEDGRVLVSDFGLARSLVAAHGGVAGTPRYMAPEQAVGHRIEASADQYSWCVALWEALHGASPTERPARAVPPRVRAVLRRGLAWAPAARWPGMPALVDAMRDALRDAMRWRVGKWAVASALGVAAATASMTVAFADTARVAPALPTITAPAPSATPEASAEIELAVERRNRGDLDGAFAILQPIVDGRSTASAVLQTRARQELARTLDVMGFATDARAHWNDAHEAAIAQNADLLAAEIAIDLARHDGTHRETVERARVWLRTAEAELRRIEIDPAEHADTVFVTALLAATEGRVREAADGFAAAAKLPADELTRVRTQIGWASALGRLGEHDLGLAKIAEGHTLCEANGLGHSVERVELRRAAGTLLQNLGRYEGAVQELELALTLAGEIRGLARGHLSSLHGDLGIFHLQANHREASELHLKKALELAPDSWVAHSNLSIHYGKLACHKDAPTPDCDTEARDLAYAHKLRAVELARAAFGEDHPTFATMRANLARELLERGEIERAREEFNLSCTQLALHFGDEAHQLMNPLYGLVEANVRLGRRDDAADAAERLHAVAHAPGFASRKDAIAVLDYVVGRTLAWDEVPEGRAAALMASGRAYFGEKPTDDFMLVDAWF